MASPDLAFIRSLCWSEMFACYRLPAMLQWHRDPDLRDADTAQANRYFPQKEAYRYDYCWKGTPGGFGMAGWSVYTADNAEEIAAFMRRHPAARMPAWNRLEA